MSSNGTPVPVIPPPQHKSRPREDELLTRKPLALWDRVKFLVLLSGIWWVLLWARLVDNPILPVGEAIDDAARTRWWLLALIGVEALRQFHYMISETSPRYHHFWTDRVFGRVEKKSSGLNDWNRYRMSRVLKAIVVVLLIALILGAATGNPPITALFEIPNTLLSAMPMIVQVVFFMFLAVIQFVAIFWFLSRGGVDVYFPDDIKTRFSDVWGQDGVVERVKENILFLEDPESIEAKGGYVPGGILLWGPPGTGKTLMAEAVAGETGKPYVFVDPGAFTNMFMGIGILKVKGLFRKLRKLSVRYGGVIVFFDEADSLGSRGQLSQPGAFGQGMVSNHAPPHLAGPTCNGSSYLSPANASLLSQLTVSASAADGERPGLISRFVMGAGMGGGGMGTLQALLTELSGLKKPRGFMNRVVRRALGMRPKPPPKYRMLVMMATNMPQALDEALLRPGRIDRIYKVGYPSKAGRVRTYQGYFDKVSHGLAPEEIDKLAIMTPYATGATIKDLVNESLIVAIRSGRQEITWQDVMTAKQLKALGPAEDGEYIERERHAVAVHEACHAVVAYRGRHHYTIDLATIERRGQVGGFVSSIPPEDRFVHWRSEHEIDIMVALASLAGERMFFNGDNSAGVSGDLQSATELATLMEGFWGMGTTIACHGVTHKAGVGGGKSKGKSAEEDLLDSELGQRIEEKLEELYRRTQEMLAANRSSVLAVAHALESHKTMTGEDVEAVMEKRQGPMVDGSVYAGESFIQAIETYHDRALVAHQGHTALDVPLPQLNGHIPAEATVAIGAEGEITI